MRLPETLGLISAACLACLACDRTKVPEPEPAPVVQFDTGQVEVRASADTFRMRVELASSDEQKQYGLMDRTQLAADVGMLFVYDAPQDSTDGFWMFRTKIPLDIAFMDSAGVVVSIRSMEPCQLIDPGLCNQYRPGLPYQTALEVNRGFFEQRGIGLGTRIVRVP